MTMIPGGASPTVSYTHLDVYKRQEMKHAAMELQFERAAELRDKILELKKLM